VTSVSARDIVGITLSSMHVNADSLDAEVRLTVDAATELANVIGGEPLPDIEHLDRPSQLRRVLVDHDFRRACDATDAEMSALADRLLSLARLVRSLPGTSLPDAVSAVNAELEAAAIAPSLSAHDGFPLHIHWTAPNTPFAHQVAVDLLMAIAQTLCDDGTERFGRCAADDCARVFYDATKNRSRRFCTDPRCASRTHTAAHRARQAASSS
jgi:predicted RNA-binding Zn ribbon-like protein